MPQNIIQQKKLWIEKRKIPSQKNQDNYFSWINDKNLQELTRDFAKRQGDNKCLKLRNTINILLINKI